MSTVTLATVSPPSPQPAWSGEVTCDGYRLVMGHDGMLAFFCDWLHTEPAPGEPRRIAVDTETGSASDGGRWEVRCVTMARGDLAVVLDPRIESHAQMIYDVLADDTYEFVFHNAAYDVPILVTWGLAPESLCDRVYDTLVTARLMPLLAGKMSLGHLAERYLGTDNVALSLAATAAGLTGSAWYDEGDIDRYVYASSAARDTAVAYAIRDRVHEDAIDWLTSANVSNAPQPDEAEAIITEVQTASRAMLHLQCQGLVVNREKAREYRDETDTMIDAAEKLLTEHGLRPGVTADLTAWLNEHGHIPADWPRTPGGALSGDKKALKKLKHIDVVDAHLKRAEAVKVREDYLGKFEDLCHPATGRLYPQIGTLGAHQTGRQNASNPPIQQIPSAARPMIATGDESWVSIDWTSVEPMIAAYASGESWVTESVLSGGDLYVPIARRAGLIPDDVSDTDALHHPGRKQAKTILLGLLYGMGVNALATSLDTDANAASSLRNAINGALPHIAQRSDHLRHIAETSGVVVTAMGRVLPVDKDHTYKAVNFYHQGSAADLLIGVLAECQRRGIASQLRLTVHDEVICTTDVADEVRDIMENYNPAMVRQLGHGVTFPTDANPLPGHWDSV